MLCLGHAGKIDSRPIGPVARRIDLLERLRKWQTAPRRDVGRAEVLRLYRTGQIIAAIIFAVHLTRGQADR
jgi:hypothetical protein